MTQKLPWPPSADLEEVSGEEVDTDESKLGRLGGCTGILGQLSWELHGMRGPGLWTAADRLKTTDPVPTPLSSLPIEPYQVLSEPQPSD